MKTCPTCQRVYEDRAKFCQQDGTSLVSETEPLVRQRFDGRYEIEALIGAGRTGRVYRARHHLLGALVALKVFAPELARDARWTEQLRDYARRAARLKHPHIVTVRDFGMDASGRPYMVMDYVEGRTLAEALQQHGRMRVHEALDALEQIAEALDDAHDAGIFYHPLRPADVFIERTPDDAHTLFKLLPPTLDDSPAGVPLTESQARAATLYTAPAAAPRARADIYSLGVICYELLAGHERFAEVTAHAEGDLRKALAGSAERWEVKGAIGPEVGHVIAGALAAERVHMFGSAKGFVADVRTALRLDGISEVVVGIKDAGRAAPPVVNTPPGAASRTTSSAEGERPLYTDENVQFTVYQPEAVAPARWYTLLAFAHLSKRRADAPADEPDPIAEVERIAARVLEDQPTDYDAVRQQSLHAVPHKSLLTFIPFVEGVEFNPPSQSFNWQKSVHKVEFELRAAASLDGQVARGRLSVFVGALLLADVPLTLRVDSAHQSAPRARPSLPASAGPYRNIFASYSHHDREIVEHIEHYVQTLGDKYLRDVTALRAGEDWQRWMKEAIAAADVFQLFWSRNSMRSAYVRAEWEYALSLGRQNFVRPVYWETPLPESPAENLPPPVLRRAHFQHLRPGISTHAAAPTGRSSAPEEDASPLPDFDARGARPMQTPPPATTVAATPPQNQLVCERCGASNPADQLFCLHCGSSLVPTLAAYPPPPMGYSMGSTSASPETQQGYLPLNMEQRAKGVSLLWVVAGVLLLLVCLLVYLLLR